MKFDIRIGHADSKRTKRLKACVLVPLSVILIPLMALLSGACAGARCAWSRLQEFVELWEQVK